MALLPRNQQIAVLGGVALAIALAVAVVLWSQSSDYSVLFSSLPDKEVGEVMDALTKLNIPHKVDSRTGSLQVPSDRLHEVRLKLAAQGMPKDGTQGFELMDQERGFGTSQMMETARYQRALEGEIARSIATLQHVKSARVHLALPKETVFVREKKKPSASVVVRLSSGHELAKDQVEAIVYLVASSVAQLEPEQVTVVDQEGHLLNSKERSGELSLTGKQFDYKKQVEEHLMGRITNILSPVVGGESLRTQVSADIDFSVTERTQEMYNPEAPALRSEQTSEDQNRGAGAQGVPGALTNQPPAAGTAPEVATGQAGQAVTEKINSSRSATRNFELDRTVSHTKVGLGGLRRVSAAVVLDNRKVLQEDGTVVSKPYSEEELARFTDLVKEAVGFDATRNDRVTVTNAAFREVMEEAEPAVDLWDRPWFWPLARQVLAALVLLAIVFGFLRPMLKLMVKGAPAETVEVGALEEQLAEDQLTLTEQKGEDLQTLLGSEADYKMRLDFAKKMVEEDPKRVAQLIKTWLASDG
ncbi:flagellar basal-body MS-ring/collar protein FliF [Methylogaea oryzae]|uniref:Flagellar M-ring protein n=3 Tax=Methylogaea oryzae TaxID=1295382 RepID=A0A8D4VLV5_9GAMM|nr:flagellar basal-body MS-ring/collar protein FliF [Methylogaea oryzae]BBL70233.1 flagellar M-ring protein [Methylogaea oryzae]